MNLILFDESITKNFDRFDHKVEVVLAHLIHWGFSSTELLSYILHSTPTTQSRFLDSLVKRQYIVRFQSDTFRRKDLVRLGPAGADFISRKWGMNCSSDARSNEFAAKSKLMHDYCLQVYTSAICRQTPFKALITSRRIIFTQADRKEKLKLPDAIVFPKEQKFSRYRLWHKPTTPKEMEDAEGTFEQAEKFWFDEEAPHAIEFERRPKSSKTFKTILVKYFYALIHGNISHVYFVGHNRATLERYQEAFESENWSNIFKITNDHPARNCFTFVVYNEPELLKLISPPKPKTPVPPSSP